MNQENQHCNVCRKPITGDNIPNFHLRLKHNGVAGTKVIIVPVAPEIGMPFKLEISWPREVHLCTPCLMRMSNLQEPQLQPKRRKKPVGVKEAQPVLHMRKDIHDICLELLRLAMGANYISIFETETLKRNAAELLQSKGYLRLAKHGAVCTSYGITAEGRAYILASLQEAV